MMSTSTSRLTAGTLMLIVAVAMRLAWSAGRETLPLVSFGVLLIMTSFAPEERRR
jgi:hypothetical protein